MYYRPREKKRSPFLTLVLTVLLVAMTAVLVWLVGVYIGYFEFQAPDLTTPFQPTPTATRSAILYVADGDTDFAQGKLNEAIEAYEQAIKRDPKLDVPYIRQSRLLVYTHDTVKAVERAAQAVTLNPDSPENLAYYCRALDWEAQYSAADDVCSCAMELDPNYAESYAFLSEVYSDQGDWRSAQALAKQALEKNFQSMDAHHNMGYAYEVQGRYAQAAEFYENAIVLAPNLAPLYIDAGLIHASLGDYDTAADRFKKAIKLMPLNPEPYSLLGRNYFLNGEYARAIDALEQSVGVDPNFVSTRRGESAWGHLGLVYYTRQNFEKAIEILPRAIELGEREYLRRVRQVEIYVESQTLTGPTSIPVLRGHFVRPDDPQDLSYVAIMEPIVYTSTVNLDPDQSCGALIAGSIKSEAALLGPTQSLTFTQAFSQTGGTARLDLATGNLTLDLDHLPQPDIAPYEIRITSWPNQIDSMGYLQPDANQKAQVAVKFERELSAPVEYYYLLGLAYAYLDPPRCEQAVPWLLKSLKIDSSGWSPAWAGLRICPSPDSPPTPIPTFTPLPEEGKTP
jgi:tetratricopeptide (TPR) repeat protein